MQHFIAFFTFFLGVPCLTHFLMSFFSILVQKLAFSDAKKGVSRPFQTVLPIYREKYSTKGHLKVGGIGLVGLVVWALDSEIQ